MGAGWVDEKKLEDGRAASRSSRGLTDRCGATTPRLPSPGDHCAFPRLLGLGSRGSELLHRSGGPRLAARLPGPHAGVARAGERPPLLPRGVPAGLPAGSCRRRKRASRSARRASSCCFSRRPTEYSASSSLAGRLAAASAPKSTSLSSDSRLCTAASWGIPPAPRVQHPSNGLGAPPEAARAGWEGGGSPM